MPSPKPKPQPKLLRVTFLIDASALGDFVYAYADTAKGLEIAPVIRVPFNKNNPAKAARAPRTSKASHAPRASISIRARARQLREALATLLRDGPMSRDAIVERLPDHDSKWVRQRTY